MRGKLSEPDKPKPRLIFSDDERRQIVRNFVEAYIANEVQIVWVSDEHVKRLRKKGVSLGDTSAYEIRRQDKKELEEWVMQVTGYTQATYREVENAITEIFRFIIRYRMGDRITGSFFKGTITEQRMKDLEDRVGNSERLIRELRILLLNVG
jgi:hypothetical protein